MLTRIILPGVKCYSSVEHLVEWNSLKKRGKLSSQFDDRRNAMHFVMSVNCHRSNYIILIKLAAVDAFMRTGCYNIQNKSGIEEE